LKKRGVTAPQWCRSNGGNEADAAVGQEGAFGFLRRPDLPVVYLTGYEIPGIEDEALGPVLRKPVDNDALIRVIKEALVSPRGC
jgi:CheY-like chemotaxis protein